MVCKRVFCPSYLLLFKTRYNNRGVSCATYGENCQTTVK